MGDVMPFRCATAIKPAISEACRWHEAGESVAASNWHIACTWQRMLFRFWWGA